jgi:hypothetical protein
MFISKFNSPIGRRRNPRLKLRNWTLASLFRKSRSNEAARRLRMRNASVAAGLVIDFLNSDSSRWFCPFDELFSLF